jgi:integrase
MIDRQNWLDIRLYLRYVANVRQNSLETVNRSRSHLRHVLEWADATSLTRAHQIAVSLPSYLVDLKLSPSSIKKGLETARGFFDFAHTHWPQRYRHIRPAWTELLQAPRGSRLESRLQVHQYYKFEDVQALAAVAVETLRQERAKVAACMLFLSGMRADAFASLPVSCVDIEHREVHQLPEMGVRTKNRKAAITFLLDIPGLLAIVERWDRRMREYPASVLWYSPLTRDGMRIIPTAIAHYGRGDLVGRDLGILCELAGVDYLSPHKLRHGHVIYALKQALNMADMKAISQNVMHASVTITDQIYGRLVNDDVRKIIASLGTKQHSADPSAEKLDQILDLLHSMQA